MLIRLFVFAGILALTACSSMKAGSLQVSDIWARPGLADGNSAAYFIIENTTSGDDVLLSASSDIAGSVELHMTSMQQDGAMQMMPQENVPVPTGKTEFKPGGLHVMLIGLKQDLNPGDKFSLTLNFATAGEMTLDVTVSEP